MPVFVHVCASGYQAVFMAESDELVQNAQMASTPGHGLWLTYQNIIAANAAAGIFGPVRSTGPMPLSAALKVGALMEACRDDRAFSLIAAGCPRGALGESLR